MLLFFSRSQRKGDYKVDKEKESSESITTGIATEDFLSLGKQE